MNINCVLTTIKKYNMLSHGDRVVVGLSGGADSVCLTHILNSLKNEYSVELIAAHVNHGIRGAEADRDEKFCREFCENSGIEFHVLKADIPALAKEKKLSEEECGRLVRYEFFNKLAGEKGKIATAHNQNDCAETLLFNLTRGSSLKGAGSIPPVRDNIIRPIIECSRQDIEEYCESNNLKFVTDSTNLENEYTRNKIRNEILPKLREINPSVCKNLASFSFLARDDEEFIQGEAENVFLKCTDGENLKSGEFNSLNISLKRRVAYKYLKQFTKADIDRKHIDAFIDFSLNRAAFQCVDALSFTKQNGVISLKKPFAEPFRIELDALSGTVDYNYGQLEFVTLSQKDLQKLNKQEYDNLIDCDKIGNTLVLRSRIDGDSFTFPKRKVTKSLKKLFNEDKISPESRNTYAVLESDGKIAWLDKYGVSKDFRVDKESVNIIYIKRRERAK